jgi:glucokinase
MYSHVQSQRQRKSRHGNKTAIGAGTGVGAGSGIITKSDQVKIPSETLLDFTLQQSVTIPKRAA